MKFTIASGASLSDAVDLAGFSYFALEMPAEWTAANLTLQAMGPSGTYRDVYDDGGNEVTITAAANRVIAISTSQLKIKPLTKVKFRSGTSSIPVNQAAARDIYIIGSR